LINVKEAYLMMTSISVPKSSKKKGILILIKKQSFLSRTKEFSKA